MAFFDFQSVPGLGTARETIENQFMWGREYVALLRSAIILSTATDAGNANSIYELRTGLVMAQYTAGANKNEWTTYNATATDGSQLAQGVLASSIKMLDLSGTVNTRVTVMVVGGPIKTNRLLYVPNGSTTLTYTGLDQQARSQMSRNFTFDDDLVGNPYPWKSWVTKAANYTVLLTDSGTTFEATTGAVTFTLPSLLDANSLAQCKGMIFRFVQTTDNAMVVARAGSDTIIAVNNASAVSLTTQTSYHIGAQIVIETNTAGTKWVASYGNVITAVVAA